MEDWIKVEDLHVSTVMDNARLGHKRWHLMGKRE